jgi:Ricin-type beta-trefoil lectin domain
MTSSGLNWRARSAIIAIPVGAVLLMGFQQAPASVSRAPGHSPRHQLDRKALGIPSPAVCKKVIYPKTRYPINANGNRVARTTASTGTVTVFHIGGSDVPVTTPPRGFNALTATQGQLRRLTIPPRPAGGSARAVWIRNYARPGHHWYTPRWMCTGNIRNSPPAASTSNWSGVEAAPSAAVVPPPPFNVAGPVISGLRGKCLDDKNDSTTPGTAAQIWDCLGDAAQQWTLRTDQTLRINGVCLDVVGNGTGNGAKVDVYTCKAATSNANQRWQLNTSGQLMNPKSGRCLDDPGSSTTNGTQLQIWACSAPTTANQVWWPAEPPAPEVGGIVGYRGLCAGSANFSAQNGNPIVIDTCNVNHDQQWTVAANGTLQVMGKCMDIVNRGTTNGSKIQLWSCNGGANQQWQYRVTAIGSGIIVNPASGKCLDDTGSSTTSGTQLQIWKCLGTANQDWSPPDPALQDNNYIAIQGQWTEPTFVTGCPSASTYSIWAGLGGDNATSTNGPHPLLQNGTDVDPNSSNMNSDYAWYEAVGIPKSLQFPETPVDFPIAAGNSVSVTTGYIPGSGSQADRVAFSFNNNTTGASLTVGPMSQVDGNPVSLFYDGSSAELIAERSTNTSTGQLYQLRKPASPGYSSFTYASIATGSVSDEAFHEDPYSEIINMTGNSGDISDIQNWQADPQGFDADSWQALWKGCS